MTINEDDSKTELESERRRHLLTGAMRRMPVFTGLHLRFVTFRLKHAPIAIPGCFCQYERTDDHLFIGSFNQEMRLMRNGKQFILHGTGVIPTV